MRRAFSLVLCLGVITATGLGFRAVSADQASSLPTRSPVDPTQAVGVLMGETWTVWRMQELLGNRSRNDQRSVRTQYFRQRPDADHAELIFETYKSPAPQAYGVLSDGTVVLAQVNDNKLLMVDRRGQTHEASLDLPDGDGEGWAMISAVIDEGIFLQPRPQRGQGGNESPLLFVPFHAGLPDPAQAVDLTGGEGTKFRPRRPMVRVWPEVAWADDRGVFVFDLVSREVREVAFDGQPERGFDEVRGFDGRFIALRKAVIDLTTGQVVGKFNDNQPITIRDGVMYELDIRRGGNGRASSMIVSARDLVANPGRAITLQEFDAYDLYWSYGSRRQPSPNMGPSMIQPTDAGLRVYDGEAWVTVPYLDRDAAAEM